MKTKRKKSESETTRRKRALKNIERASRGPRRRTSAQVEADRRIAEKTKRRRAARGHAAKFFVSVSYKPGKDESLFALNDELHKVLGYSDGSGFSFASNKRDMQWDFRTKRSAEAAGRKVTKLAKRLKRKLKIKVKPIPTLEEAERAWNKMFAKRSRK